MIYLLLSIALSVITVSFFKLFERFGVNTFPAIVANYFSCVAMGNLLNPEAVLFTSFWNEPWIVLSAILGLLFISIFYAIGKTSQQMGISVSMVAAKLSVVIPVAAAILLYSESITWYKILGFVLSLIAVVCISIKDTTSASNGRMWLLPIIVFAGSGLIDTLLNHVNMLYIPPANEGNIISMVFFFAAVLGTTVLILKKILGTGMPISSKDVLWGLALGIPNYGSMYFLLVTLNHFNEAAYIFPVNNIGIASISTIVSYVAFSDRISKLNLLGLLLAVVAIIVLSV
jgi:drug/metabolite transporter (DMT)-like permease